MKLIPIKFRELSQVDFVKEVHRYLTPAESKDHLETILSHSRLGNSDAVKLQAIEIIGLMGEAAAPKIDAIAGVLNDKEPILRAAALHTLGAIGVKAIDPIIRVIDDPKEEPEMRIAALSALSRMGEKAEKARGVLTKIIQNPANLDDPTASRTALLQQALLTLASMGEKALSEVPILETLSKQLPIVKEKRMNSDDYKKWRNNPETARIFNKLTEKQREEYLKNQPEDQFKKFVDEAIEFIRKSTPGHPGGESKPTGEPKKT
jgi:HEAT repeat protein